MVNKVHNKEMEETLLKYSLWTPDKIYVDVTMLKDFTLGGLLLHLYKTNNLTKETYNYIFSGMDTWNTRITDSIKDSYPDLAIDIPKDFNTYIRNKYDHNIIYKMSPETQATTFLCDQLLDINTKTAASKKTTVPTMVLNTFPYVFLDSNIDTLQAQWQSEFGINVEAISTPVEALGEKEILTFDTIFVYDIEKFLNKGYPELFTSDKFSNKNIYSFKNTNNISSIEDIKNNRTDLETSYVVTEAYISIVSNFNYIDKSVIVGG